uniref:Integrase catalytic domain-containing protein n=1 Tax=Tanacetum cinerariifolium TaxID=118510 RepID=A0A6L2KRS1_TANCI|nr:hypothetical protein [Tanacetum cinerariifolium]
MTTLAEFVILSSADNRPPMLEKQLANISGIGGNNSGQQRVMKCFNCQGKCHMARQCLNPKRKRDATWFRDKVLLVEAQGSAYQVDDLDAYDSDLDDFTSKTVLVANLSDYGSDVLFEVNKDNLIANESLFAELEKYKERLKLLEERQNVDLSTREKLIMDDIIREKNVQFADFEKEINYFEQTLLDQSKEKGLLTKTFNVFKNESKEKEPKNIDKEIALENKLKELDNSVSKMGLSTITSTNQVPFREPILPEVIAQESIVTKVYTKRPKVPKTNGSNSKPKISKSVISNKTEPDLEVPFRKHMCFVRNLEGDDLLSGSREANLYTLSMGDMIAFSPTCLLSKASKTKSWLWHQRLSHLNFDAINHLAKNGLVRGKLYLLHMDLYGPMRVTSINEKKYILIIVDDYSLFTWVTFLALKDEAPNFIIMFLKMIQVRLNTPVRNICTNNGTEFVNQTLRRYYESVGISHETSAEAVATACYTQNQSIIWRRHRKTPYELLHDKKPYLSYLHVFGALCYPNNDSEDLGKLQAKADIGPRLQCMTYATFSSGLVSNHLPQQPCIPPLRYDWDHLFQLMFDEYFNPPTISIFLVPVVDAPRAVDLANSPVSMSIDQVALLKSIPSTQKQEHSLIISQGFEELPKHHIFMMILTPSKSQQCSEIPLWDATS